MNGTDQNRPGRAHPIVAVLREQGRAQSWLARRIGRSHEHTNRVLNGLHPATAAFRAACALALAMPETSLFHDASGGSRPEGDSADGSISPDGTAVGHTAYAAAGGAVTN